MSPWRVEAFGAEDEFVGIVIDVNERKLCLFGKGEGFENPNRTSGFF
jgi:hypothetical protein